MKNLNKQVLISQIKSIVVYQFLNRFNQLEILMRKVFENSLKDVDVEQLHRLYFYYGGRIATYIDYETDTLRLREIKFKEDEKFKDLSITQIIKINKEAKFVKGYNFSFSSIQRESTVFDFQGSVLKLINMRNILAHELLECFFKDKDIIEILSNEKIVDLQFDFLVNYDFSLMDDMTKTIVSNFYYMGVMIDELKMKLVK